MERYYPFEHRNEQEPKTDRQDTLPEVQKNEESGTSFPKGKGRRGGNSAASVVIHSGRGTERTQKTAGHETVKTGEEAGRRQRAVSADRAASSGASGFRHGSGDGRKAADRNGRDQKSGHGNQWEDRRGRDSGRTAGKRTPGKSAGRDENGPERTVPEIVGKRLVLTVAENASCGAFLETGDGKRILLPFSEQLSAPVPGDRIEVSVYEDKGGRLTATMRRPILKVGETGVLKVAAVTKIGAFLDNGMPKQVLVPFREMLHTPAEGDEVLVWIYLDKSGREAGTMRVYRHLERESGYKAGDHVEAFVYEVNPDIGVFTAVDDRFCGMIPIQEVYQKLHYGDRISARVSRVREDGKLDLLLREKLYEAADADARKLLQVIRENGGTLPYADRADAELVREKFSMSKNEFKRALGYLYKKRKIEIDREKDTVRLLTPGLTD